jgi:hypothetical protein
MNGLAWAQGLDLPDLRATDTRRFHGVSEISVHLARKFPLTVREDTFLVKLFQISEPVWDRLRPEEKRRVMESMRRYSAYLLTVGLRD